MNKKKRRQQESSEKVWDGGEREGRKSGDVVGDGVERRMMVVKVKAVWGKEA